MCADQQDRYLIYHDAIVHITATVTTAGISPFLCRFRNLRSIDMEIPGHLVGSGQWRDQWVRRTLSWSAPISERPQAMCDWGIALPLKDVHDKVDEMLHFIPEASFSSFDLLGVCWRIAGGLDMPDDNDMADGIIRRGLRSRHAEIVICRTVWGSRTWDRSLRDLQSAVEICERMETETFDFVLDGVPSLRAADLSAAAARQLDRALSAIVRSSSLRPGRLEMRLTALESVTMLNVAPDAFTYFGELEITVCMKDEHDFDALRFLRQPEVRHSRPVETTSLKLRIGFQDEAGVVIASHTPTFATALVNLGRLVDRLVAVSIHASPPKDGSDVHCDFAIDSDGCLKQMDEPDTVHRLTMCEYLLYAFDAAVARATASAPSPTPSG